MRADRYANQLHSPRHEQSSHREVRVNTVHIERNLTEQHQVTDESVSALIVSSYEDSQNANARIAAKHQIAINVPDGAREEFGCFSTGLEAALYGKGVW